MTFVPLKDTGSRYRTAGQWQSVAATLQREIIFGRLQPRERLVEDEIIERTGASRHAVRRAFDEMSQNGLVVRLPHKGARVRSYTAEEVNDLYELRETLEAKAALRILLPAPAQLIEELAAIQQEHEAASRAGDVVRLFEANNHFHEALYSACGNATLAEAIRLYSTQTHPIRMRSMSDDSWREEAVRQHWRMIEALGKGDNSALAALCLTHIRAPKEFYLSLYRNGGGSV